MILYTEYEKMSMFFLGRKKSTAKLDFAVLGIMLC